MQYAVPRKITKTGMGGGLSTPGRDWEIQNKTLCIIFLEVRDESKP